MASAMTAMNFDLELAYELNSCMSVDLRYSIYAPRRAPTEMDLEAMERRLPSKKVNMLVSIAYDGGEVPLGIAPKSGDDFWFADKERTHACDEGHLATLAGLRHLQNHLQAEAQR